MHRSIKIAVAVLFAAHLLGCAGYRAAKLYQSGTTALNAGETERAVLELEQAALLAPDASEIQNHLGLALAAGGQRQQALAAFERAVDLDCQNAAAKTNLAATRFQAPEPRRVADETAAGEL
ncbi:MAG: Flp pilus assembly protein TadD [Myxococcota bacterium]|jgi:Flp pilus assembly protein TadD